MKATPKDDCGRCKGSGIIAPLSGPAYSCHCVKSLKKATAKSDKHESHDDARVVLSRPLVVTAGGSFSHAPIQAARLVMAGNPKPIIEGLPGYVPIIIRLDWPDMGTPEMSAADWKWLSGRIRSLNRPLHVSCAMGHGRTGSCLAILAHFWGQIPKGADPVAWVRERYCPGAIETASQIFYIERMTGRKSKAKPAMPKTGSLTGGVAYGGVYTDDMGFPGPQPIQAKGGGYYCLGMNNQCTGRAVEPSRYCVLHEPAKPPSLSKPRYCARLTNGILCPKPAADGQILCDAHYYATLPPLASFGPEPIQTPTEPTK